jgi:hypothetical protein
VAQISHPQIRFRQVRVREVHPRKIDSHEVKPAKAFTASNAINYLAS